MSPPDSHPPRPGPRARAVLLAAVLLVAACGLAYEILTAAVSTYLLGDGVLQFSLAIGIFLTAMGAGSWLSRYVRRRLVATFVGVELAVGLLGAAAAPTLFWAYTAGVSYVPVLVAILGGIGALTGMEIPLVLRILHRDRSLRETAASVLGLDYAGALVAALLVPIVLVPVLGTIGTGCLFGLLNLLVGALCVVTFPEAFGPPARRRVALALIALVAVPMTAAIPLADQISRTLEAELYQDPVVLSRQTRFQRITLTRWRGDLRLFLNGSLQFSSVDEYRYHEALVHPAMAAAPRRGRVLVLGGGDGLAAREILRWPDVESVDLVDLDAGVTDLARTHPDLVRLNQGALSDPRLRLHHQDALTFLEATDALPWDVILMDLPDPSTPGLARLYASSSFRLVARRLAAHGVLAAQATSPFFAGEAFWCIADTMTGHLASGPGGRPLAVYPYRTTVPSFGLWGFVLATAIPFDPHAVDVTVPTRHLTTSTLPQRFVFPPDEARPPGPRCENRLDDAHLARLYRRGWSRYGE